MSHRHSHYSQNGLVLHSADGPVLYHPSPELQRAMDGAIFFGFVIVIAIVVVVNLSRLRPAPAIMTEKLCGEKDQHCTCSGNETFKGGRVWDKSAQKYDRTGTMEGILREVNKGY